MPLRTIEPVTTNCKYCTAEFTYVPANRAQAINLNRRGSLMTKRNVCDLCRDSTARRDRCVKLGPEFADETKRERELREIKAHLRDYIFGISFVKPQPGLSYNSHEQAWPMADNECEHGRLPTDKTPPCGCYGER